MQRKREQYMNYRRSPDGSLHECKCTTSAAWQGRSLPKTSPSSRLGNWETLETFGRLAPNACDMQEATERMAQLESDHPTVRHLRQDLHDPSALPDAASRARVEHRRHAIKVDREIKPHTLPDMDKCVLHHRHRGKQEEQAELQRNVQRKHAEGLRIFAAVSRGRRPKLCKCALARYPPRHR